MEHSMNANYGLDCKALLSLLLVPALLQSSSATSTTEINTTSSTTTVPEFSYYVGDWSDCSATCEIGSRQREVFCYRTCSNPRLCTSGVTDWHCLGTAKPSETDLCFGAAPVCPVSRQPPRVPEVALYAASTDTFDPWTVLKISPDAGVEEAKKAYRKLAAKYHPDVDPSPKAYEMFQKLVRANAVITGEDKGLDETTLLNNAANNLRDNIEYQKERIEKLKKEAAAEEQRVQEMQEQQKKVEEKRDQVSGELGLLGGSVLGLIAGGPTGLILGAIAGIALGKRTDSVGKVIRGAGTVVKGVFDAVQKAAGKSQE